MSRPLKIYVGIVVLLVISFLILLIIFPPPFMGSWYLFIFFMASVITWTLSCRSLYNKFGIRAIPIISAFIGGGALFGYLGCLSMLRPIVMLRGDSLMAMGINYLGLAGFPGNTTLNICIGIGIFMGILAGWTVGIGD